MKRLLPIIMLLAPLTDLVAQSKCLLSLTRILLPKYRFLSLVVGGRIVLRNVLDRKSVDTLAPTFTFLLEAHPCLGGRKGCAGERVMALVVRDGWYSGPLLR